jgi:hypothetical protein
MNFFLNLLQATSTPMPTTADTYFSPGTVGFVVTFTLAASAVALIFDMNRRIRRNRYRTEIRERLANEELTKEIGKPERPAPPAKPNRSASPESGQDQ